MARDRPGPYQVQAAIAAQHALADSFARTDWATVRALYDMLDTLAPSPVVRLNRAVATRFTEGPGTALAEVDALAPQRWPWPPTRPSETSCAADSRALLRDRR